ncbi:hypothetical protein BGL48_15530 [Salinivibrio sp. SS3]|uniref:molybdopterin-dependent oxidoreductase n=1 Tax=Salinivibrio sp. SS3 TaxID=1895021 RepID=UPI000847F6E2|nr:molybdopterin-dependent oxidoreductase [Salinivibrio sp. BNH]ODP96982.1 hypothetical protein BGL48_15530 [Salinivibrio sp. BNH]
MNMQSCPTYITVFCASTRALIPYLVALFVWVLAVDRAQASLRLPLSLTLTVGDAERITFDRQQLDKLPHIDIRTHTPFTAGLQTFRGVKLSTVLEAANVSHYQALTLHAMNHYQARLPQDVVTRYQPIIAFERNGKPMTIRTLGPLWLIYPLDDYPQLQSDRFYETMVWQLTDIEVEP